MTVPMVAWMRYRGHGWPASAEMAASMFLPTFGVIALALERASSSDIGTLLLIEHVAMLPSMLVAMLLRRDEYTGACTATATAGGGLSATAKLAGFAAVLLLVFGGAVAVGRRRSARERDGSDTASRRRRWPPTAATRRAAPTRCAAWRSPTAA